MVVAIHSASGSTWPLKAGGYIDKLDFEQRHAPQVKGISWKTCRGSCQSMILMSKTC